MRITRSSIDTQKGPADWFTGDVYIDAVARGHVDLPLLNGRRGACPGRAGDAEQLFELADGVLAAAVQRDQASTLNNSRPTGSVGVVHGRAERALDLIIVELAEQIG